MEQPPPRVVIRAVRLIAESPKAFCASDGDRSYWFPKSQARYVDRQSGKHSAWIIDVHLPQWLAVKSGLTYVEPHYD